MLCSNTLTSPVELARPPGLPSTDTCAGRRHHVSFGSHSAGASSQLPCAPASIRFACHMKTLSMRHTIRQVRTLTCGWPAVSWIRHCAEAIGAPTLLWTCGTKLKVTVEGEAADRLGPPVMVALAGVLLTYISMSLRPGPAALKCSCETGEHSSRTYMPYFMPLW